MPPPRPLDAFDVNALITARIRQLQSDPDPANRVPNVDLGLVRVANYTSLADAIAHAELAAGRPHPPGGLARITRPAMLGDVAPEEHVVVQESAWRVERPDGSVFFVAAPVLRGGRLDFNPLG